MAVQVVIVVSRSNWLARDVSGMEMTIAKQMPHKDIRQSCDHPVFHESPCPGECVNTFQAYQQAIQEGKRQHGHLAVCKWPFRAVSGVL